MTTKKEEEMKAFKEAAAGWKGLVAYCIKYHFWKVASIIFLGLVWYNVASNLKISDGKIQWVPSIKTEIEVKK